MNTQTRLNELQEARDLAEHERDLLWSELCRTVPGDDGKVYFALMETIRAYGAACRRAEREHWKISALLRIDPGLKD